MTNKLVLTSVAAVALFGLAACSDTDENTTQSIEPPANTQPVPMQPTPNTERPMADEPAAAPDTDTQSGNGTSANEIRPVE